MGERCAVRWLWTSLIISAFIPGVALTGDWVVHVPVNPILAPHGSSVTIPCTYSFPESGSHQVQSEMWCLNQSLCITPTYVYHSANIFLEPAYRGRVQYLGSLGSRNCSLRIGNLRMKDSGVYVFRFVTDHTVKKLPEQKGVTLQVTAFIPGVALTGDWVVHVPVNPILAPHGSSVTIPCTYSFPESGSHQVQSEMWCLNQSLCITPTYVYHSANIFLEPAYQGRVQYLGSLGSRNCSLRIGNLRMKDSGVYVFRFVTDHTVKKLPEQKGVTLQVTDPPVNTSVMVTTSSKIVEGTSVTLSCTSITASSPTTFRWYQMNRTATLRGTGQKLTIEHLNSEDSGMYTCVAQNTWGSQNATIILTVQKAEGSSSASTVGIVVGIVFVLTVIATIVACAKRNAASKSLQTMFNDDGNL